MAGELKNKENYMQFIELGNHKIEVSILMNNRMVRHSDTKDLLQLNDDEISDYFIDAGIIPDTLFRKIYFENSATKEQEAIYKGLVMVGIYPIIDEVCKVDLRGISYVDEFAEIIKIKTRRSCCDKID